MPHLPRIAMWLALMLVGGWSFGQQAEPKVDTVSKTMQLHSVKLDETRTLLIKSDTIPDAMRKAPVVAESERRSAAHAPTIDMVAVSAHVVIKGEPVAIWVKRLALIAHFPDLSPRLRVMDAKLSDEGLFVLLALPDGRISLEIAPWGGNDRSVFLPDDWNLRARRTLLTEDEVTGSIDGSIRNANLTVSLIDRKNENKIFIYQLSPEGTIIEKR